jgi:hypothetical protein
VLLIKRGNHFRDLGLEKGYTREQLAYEAKIETLQVLATALNMSINDLLKGL